ncbi:hypothetical protein G4177_05800 [Corallococcus sp. ZKHCc1 1396]|uniref:Uncharacterized protein n=1 Tax=Corallococcus soli TaxID=2710757 RepID=A0ABR9PID4_9BACT|nr:hypothetical protein [Corallococcus soli]MBE4747693.1 hypothetical protein [Corallococcus soli]
MAIDDLRANGMMSHLLTSLEAGEDIGHYGRLLFAMVARHFQDLRFPESVYAHIGEYREQKAHAASEEADSTGAP